MDSILVAALLPRPCLPDDIINMPYMELVESRFRSPGHPWYYRQWGPLHPDQIQPRTCNCLSYVVTDIKTPAIKLKRAKECLLVAQQELISDRARYMQLYASPGVYLPSSRYATMNMNHLHGVDMEWCSAIAYKYNHVTYRLAEIRDLTNLINELEPCVKSKR